MKEKVKKHLINMISNVNYDKAIEENFKYFEYLKQPQKIAEAIARTI